MRRFYALMLVALLAALPATAIAQATQSFNPTALPAALSVSNSSSRVAFPSAGPSALILNTGSVDSYLALGGSGVTATTSGYLLKAGCALALNVNGQGFIAAITSASTTTLSIWTGGGLPTLPPTACVQTVTFSGGTIDTITNPVGVKGADGSTIASATNGLPTSTSPGARTLVTLDVKTVTTGGTAVTAIAIGNRTAGGLLCNPVGATINMGINEIGTAAGTTSSGDTTFIVPGQCYNVAPAASAVSVITSDSAHPFSGYGLK